MATTEQTVCYEHGRVVLAAAGSEGSRVLGQGDVLEIFEYGRFQLVTVQTGGYGGWYYEDAAGRRARFAVGMRVRNYQAAQPVASQVQWCPCKKSHCSYPDCPLGDPRSSRAGERSMVCIKSMQPQNYRAICANI